MRYEGSEPEIIVRAYAQTDAPRPAHRPLVRRRPLAVVLAELNDARSMRNALIAVGDLRHASELDPVVERLTAEYTRRRDAPPVRPPL
ncbi:hypothetical protein [Baekduia sp. Peel2402]|uniref:hypothetical protein n=1 Tax=Baekduia sp. Peel2402 TaxID=3458296 RepID=UPI00403EDB84